MLLDQNNSGADYHDDVDEFAPWLNKDDLHLQAHF